MKHTMQCIRTLLTAALLVAGAGLVCAQQITVTPGTIHTVAALSTPNAIAVNAH